MESDFYFQNLHVSEDWKHYCISNIVTAESYDKFVYGFNSVSVDFGYYIIKQRDKTMEFDTLNYFIAYIIIVLN